MDSRYYLEADLAQRSRDANAIASVARARTLRAAAEVSRQGLRVAIGPLEVFVRVSRRAQPSRGLAGPA